MNWRGLPAIATVVLLAACDLPFGKKAPATDSTATATPPAAQQADSGATGQDTAAPAVTPTPRQTPAGGPEPTAMQPRPVGAQLDEPWTPTATGSVDPGMTRDQVVAAWGTPVAERTSGEWTYLYFRNGCEVSCGTFDVVLLQNGQVVDAIVRASAHQYTGTSSSPPGRDAKATLPGPASQGGV